LFAGFGNLSGKVNLFVQIQKLVLYFSCEDRAGKNPGLNNNTKPARLFFLGFIGFYCFLGVYQSWARAFFNASRFAFALFGGALRAGAFALFFGP
jgi:hypothetical protein